MKSTMKLFLVIVIAASTVFADGDLGNGGRTCEGDLGNGGITCTVECEPLEPCEPNNNGTNTQTTGETSDGDSVLTIISDYLTSLLG